MPITLGQGVPSASLTPSGSGVGGVVSALGGAADTFVSRLMQLRQMQQDQALKEATLSLQREAEANRQADARAQLGLQQTLADQADQRARDLAAASDAAAAKRQETANAAASARQASQQKFEAGQAERVQAQQERQRKINTLAGFAANALRGGATPEEASAYVGYAVNDPNFKAQFQSASRADISAAVDMAQHQIALEKKNAGALQQLLGGGAEGGSAAPTAPAATPAKPTIDQLVAATKNSLAQHETVFNAFSKLVHLTDLATAHEVFDKMGLVPPPDSFFQHAPSTPPPKWTPEKNTGGVM